MTTAIYARVSTDKQDSSRQVEECKDAVDGDWSLYADVASGATWDREDLQRLINDIESGDVDEVVTWEISRISRKLAHAAEFIDLCVEHNVELRTLNDMFPSLSGDDVMDKMMAQFTTWMMEFEREMIRERVISGVHRAMDEGKWVGRPPYGFEINDDGRLEVLPEDYLAMQTAVEMAETSDKSQNKIAESLGVPQSSLSRILNDEEKRRLYLYGEADDERLDDAVSDVSRSSELASLRERIDDLESRLDG